MTAPQAEDFTELVDAEFPRVDLVGKAANGTTFLIRKAAADDGLTHPLIPADMVRDLIEKAQEAPVTDPAPDDVAKADGDTPVAADDLVPDAPAGSTANSLPGSPDWETLDGETAMGAVATLGRVKACLGWLADREAQEAVTGGDPGDADNSFDLDDMACTLDYLIGRLAGFAVGEQMEADVADELGQVGKAAADMVAPLTVVERLAPIAKAGRTFSAANEATMRGAVDDIDTAAEKLRGLLNSLPQAPAADVTKETAVPEITEPETPAVEPSLTVDDITKGARELTQFEVFRALLAGATTVAKAAGDPQLAVFDANGTLIGTVDPAKLSPIATSPAAAEKADAPADEAPAEEATETPAEEAAEPAAAAPAAEDAATIPGTATVQSPPEQDPNAVAKAAALAALEEFRTQVTEEVRQGLETELTVLKERVEKMGAKPDDRRSPVLNGGTGVAGAITRDGGTSGDDLAAVRKAIADEPDPDKKIELSKQAFFAQVAARFQ